MSGSGNMIPMSRTTMRPSSSKHAQFRPISPRPPRKMMRTGSGKRSARACSGNGVHVAPEVGDDLAGPVVELARRGTEWQPALAGREPEGPARRLGGQRVRERLARLEVVGLEQRGVRLAPP